MSQFYEQDFYAWANEQAALLRAGKLGLADIENIAEEIESMGRSEKRELASRLTVLLLHLLKWQFQPGLRGASWEATILVQRIRLADHLTDNPSLKPRVADTITSAYRLASIEAVAETGMNQTAFPQHVPGPRTRISGRRAEAENRLMRSPVPLMRCGRPAKPALHPLPHRLEHHVQHRN